ncbi:MAG: hypothetical protein EHM20_15270 [Alphaproteobacteria bacterium]|nr:MAG: hypothetical protein EHM20_15270 [Alphaproteobacteria bacterium]
MNKKIIVVFILIFGSALVWWKSQQSTTLFSPEKMVESRNSSGSTRSGSEILANDQAKLEGNLSPSILSDKNWKAVNDYALNVKTLVSKDNAKELFELTQGSVKDLASCLKKDFCGMEKRSDADAYFDDKKTPGHILLGRNLEIMVAALERNKDLKAKLDWELVRELTDSENEKIQVLALDIIKNYDPENSNTDKLLEIADKFEGNAKANALEKIADKEKIKNSLNDRILLVNALEKSFAQDDPHTVISIVEKMGKMNLSEDEILKVSRNLCHFKEDHGEDDPNWKMIKYNMKKITDLNKICN